MKICLARLRNTLRYRGPFQDIVDSFAELLRRYVSARRGQHEFSFYRMSLDGSMPPREPSAIARADVVVIISEAEFAWQTKGSKNQMHVNQSEEALARIAPLFRGKPLVLLTFDRADTPELFQTRTFHDIPLGHIEELDEIDLKPSVNVMKFWFIRNAYGSPRPGADRLHDFCYWGAASKAKLPGGAPSGDKRHAVLREIKKALGPRAYFIGNFPYRDMQFTRDFTKIIPPARLSRFTLCFNWLDANALTARYFEASACGLVPLTLGYDEGGLVSEDWQRVASAEEALARMAELAPHFDRWQAKAERRLLAAMPSAEEMVARFARALDRKLDRCIKQKIIASGEHPRALSHARLEPN